jgi:hypothetical protein
VGMAAVRPAAAALLRKSLRSMVAPSIEGLDADEGREGIPQGLKPLLWRGGRGPSLKAWRT